MKVKQPYLLQLDSIPVSDFALQQFAGVAFGQFRHNNKFLGHFKAGQVRLEK
jgi:hypothetical protein